MTGFSFGARSLENMVGVHPKLVRVLNLAIKKSKVDFMVIEGVRSLARQKQLYAQGRTTPGKVVTWTLNSNHFKKADGFGHAVDILPAPYDWKDTAPFDAVADAMFAAAKELGVRIRWGADWDRDGKPRERGETDSPHWELDE
jgi:peptidoglycan L-alanyl-D-glutamate endopeptidase CwlK